MPRPRYPRYAPEGLERRLSPGTLAPAAEVAAAADAPPTFPGSPIPYPPTPFPGGPSEPD
jgi:hypothetical protein